MAKAEKTDKAEKAEKDTAKTAADGGSAGIAGSAGMSPVQSAVSEPTTLSEMGHAKAAASPLRDPARDPKSGTKVRAKSDGFYNGALREKGKKSGEFYLLPGDKPAKWMEVIGAPKTEE